MGEVRGRWEKEGGGGEEDRRREGDGEEEGGGMVGGEVGGSSAGEVYGGKFGLNHGAFARVESFTLSQHSVAGSPPRPRCCASGCARSPRHGSPSCTAPRRGRGRCRDCCPSRWRRGRRD